MVRTDEAFVLGVHPLGEWGYHLVSPESRLDSPATAALREWLLAQAGVESEDDAAAARAV